MGALARTHRVQDMPRPMVSAAEFGKFIGFGEIDAITERYAHQPDAASR